jgi:glutamine---fructose-6-phosphate transaminase (isomerizing)
MCGIVGGIASQCIVSTLLTGLQRLAYRGYDSAGLSVFDPNASKPTLLRARAQGKVSALVDALNQKPISGNTGIAHTRWATHGEASEHNAHPHLSHGSIAVVHNGIIENHASLRKKLEEQGYHFASDTDTEVVAHLLHHELAQQSKTDMHAALHATRTQLQGAYALGIMSHTHTDTLIAVRQGSPLVVGCSEQGHYLASDVGALMGVAQDFIFLEDGDVAWLTRDAVHITDRNNQPVERPRQQLETHANDLADKGAFRHHMAQEMFAQPDAVRRTTQNWAQHAGKLSMLFGEQAEAVFQQCEQVHIVACGTSYHAGLVAQHWLNSLSQLPTQVFIASEYRYQNTPIPPNTLLISLSQSGETADTLAAIRYAKTQSRTPYLSQLAICNMPHATLVRESNLHFITQAGREIGVAATKTFTCQLVALLGMSLAITQSKQSTVQGKHLDADIAGLLQAVHTLPEALDEALTHDHAIRRIAQDFTDKAHCLFLGRNACWPIAMEGALKLKEISYVHAEAYAAGELKHGPLALIDHAMPVVVLAPNDALHAKLQANIEEVHARGGQVYIFGSASCAHSQAANPCCLLQDPHPMLIPIVYTIPMQLLSYHVAVLKGTDVDQPRNLAKSVTVE